MRPDKLEHEHIVSSCFRETELRNPVLIEEGNPSYSCPGKVTSEIQDGPERRIMSSGFCADKMYPRQCRIKRQEQNEILSLPVKEKVQTSVDTLIHPLDLRTG